jgi:hypothetical protein
MRHRTTCASDFGVVERVVRAHFSKSPTKPGMGILLLLDVDDTLVRTDTRMLNATDPELCSVLSRLQSAGVRIKILTARPPGQASCLELYTHLARIKVPRALKMSQYAMMTGGKVDKGTALVSSPTTMRNIHTVVFVDDVKRNLIDMAVALRPSNVTLRNILFQVPKVPKKALPSPVPVSASRVPS